jgi:HlyD family secretion protein
MNIRRRFTKRRIIIIAVVLLVLFGIGYKINSSKNDTSNILTDTVKRMDLKQTVLATGQVASETDLNLSFRSPGTVKKINVGVGARVKGGDVLAILDQKDLQAALTSARGSLAAAQANYQKVLDGASSEEVAIAQAAVDSAQVTLNNAKLNLDKVKSQQQVLVDNAYQAMLNIGLTAVPHKDNKNTGTPTITGTYTGKQQGEYVIRQYYRDFYATGIESTITQPMNTFVPVALGTKGLFVQFPENYVVTWEDRWTVSIPNTSSANYITYNNAYTSALETQNSAIASAEASVSSAQSALDSAMAQLNLKKAQARPAEIKAAQAQVLSAQGQVESALANLENTVIRAPVDGTVTKIDIKVGELAQALIPYVILQDIGKLYLKANISEANISIVQLGQDVEITLDALGYDRKFTGTVREIDPSSTVISGVVNYKVTVSIDAEPDIKPGMTANMTIYAKEKSSVLAVPARAILSKDDDKFIRVISNSKTKEYMEVGISLGLNGDGGLVEVLSGLSEGQEIITFIGKK